MDKLVAKQTHIEINDYDLGDNQKVEYTFSVYDMTYHTYFYKGMIYDKDNRKLLLPRGIDLRWLENVFYDSVVVDTSFDEYDYMNTQIGIKYLPRDDEQKQAIRFMLGEQEYELNKAYPALSVNLNTGKGKTYCTIATMAFLQMKTMIITSSLNWLNQWKDFILEYTNLTESDIVFISGTPTILRLMNNKKLINKTNIYLVSHNTIKSYGDTYGWDKVTEFFKALRIGIKVFDEAHLNFDNMCAIDFYTNTFKTYYVTATPMRSDDSEDRVYQLFMKNIPSIDLFDQDNDPHTKYIGMRYNSHPTALEASNCKNQYGLDRNKYTNYVVHKESFHEIMQVLMNKIRTTPGKVLIYIGTNAAIEVVKEWIENCYPTYRGNVGVYTSVVTENKEAQLDKKIILSTTKSCGAAMDIKGLSLTIVLAEPFKSKVLARQTLGRTRADNTTYIDVVDDGFFYTKKYYIAKSDVFEKYATECKEIRLNDSTLSQKAMENYDKYLHSIQPFRTQSAPIQPFTIREQGQLIKPMVKIDKFSDTVY